ncbi:MAG: hypothetical protein LBI99_10610 [Propionibacteriaceae bacterium]|jgi:hypothetical protein|nr:hypothetical protein [Propionibacteriaceae bacterium]
MADQGNRADLADNADPARLDVLDEATKGKLTAQYAALDEALGNEANPNNKGKYE